MTVLNPGQFDAVNTMSGPLLVLAGAGTGKTRVITFRIAKLIKSGVPAERILGVTFTNKAATEMQERLEMMLGRGNSTKPFISTFHSLCVRILRRHIEALGYPERFSIYNRGDQEAVANNRLDSLVAMLQLCDRRAQRSINQVAEQSFGSSSELDQAQAAAGKASSLASAGHAGVPFPAPPAAPGALPLAWQGGALGELPSGVIEHIATPATPQALQPVAPRHRF